MENIKLNFKMLCRTNKTCLKVLDSQHAPRLCTKIKSFRQISRLCNEPVLRRLMPGGWGQVGRKGFWSVSICLHSLTSLSFYMKSLKFQAMFLKRSAVKDYFLNILSVIMWQFVIYHVNESVEKWLYAWVSW